MSDNLWHVMRLSDDGEKWLPSDSSPLDVNGDPTLTISRVKPVGCLKGGVSYITGPPPGKAWLLVEVDDE